MTFGEIKSIIEESLIESYKDPKEFKKMMNEFHHNILTNKSISKLYSLYDDLSAEKGFNEEDARDYLQEGIEMIRQILPKTKLPKFSSKNITNKYSDIDTLVYGKNSSISERVRSKKQLLENLKSTPKTIKESINIPVSSMVTVANQTLKNYIENMDDSAKKNFLKVVKGDPKELENEFGKLKENTIGKLEKLLVTENEFETKTKISETIERLKTEKFTEMNFVRLSDLEKSI